MKKSSHRRPVIEPLPKRLMLSVSAQFSAVGKELKVTGDEQDNQITISRDTAGNIVVNGGAVPIAGDVPTVANCNHLHLVGAVGNDTIVLDQTNGPLPAAALFGGAGNDSLVGGSGDDFAQGEAGNDTISLGAGEDEFIWLPGDNSDVVDAGTGQDQFTFNGNDLAEQIGIQPAGNRVQFTRDVGSVSVDLGGFEMIEFNAFGGADTITVGDQSATGLTHVDLDLAGTTLVADGQADSVVVEGNDAQNLVNVSDGAEGTSVDTTATTVLISNADATLDTLRVNTFGDTDIVHVSQLGSPGSVRRVQVDPGDAGDRTTTFATAANGSVTIIPSTGNDDVGADASFRGFANIKFDTSQRVGHLSIQNGATATLTSGGAKVLTVVELDMGGDSKLDLTDNDLIVDYTGPSPIDSIAAKLANGRNGGAWNGHGIVTSAGDASHFALGYGEAGSLFPGGTFAGQPVDATAVVVKFTRYGDANLDGQVDVTDLGRLATAWQTSGRDWSGGDFNYDSTVDVSDLGLLATNWQTSVSSPASVLRMQSVGTHRLSLVSDVVM